jgi:hypothetical protein
MRQINSASSSGGDRVGSSAIDNPFRGIGQSCNLTLFEGKYAKVRGQGVDSMQES